MSESFNTGNDRSTITTRFLLVYIICILCAVVPLYYLFSIPDKAIQKLKVSELSEKKQRKNIERYKEIMVDLDKFLTEKKLEKEYRDCIDVLYRFAKDSVDEKNLYKPLFIKIADLYENLGKMNEGGGKAEIDKLKAQIDKMTEDQKQAERDLKNCEKENLQLMLKK